MKMLITMSHQQNSKNNNKVGFIPQKQRGGNTPVYMRQELSKHMLRSFPEYKELFKECPACSRNALKPTGYKKMSPSFIKVNSSTLERTCSMCGFVHKPLAQFTFSRVEQNRVEQKQQLVSQLVGVNKVGRMLGFKCSPTN